MAVVSEAHALHDLVESGGIAERDDRTIQHQGAYHVVVARADHRIRASDPRQQIMHRINWFVNQPIGVDVASSLPNTFKECVDSTLVTRFPNENPYGVALVEDPARDSGHVLYIGSENSLAADRVIGPALICHDTKTDRRIIRGYSRVGGASQPENQVRHHWGITCRRTDVGHVRTGDVVA